MFISAETPKEQGTKTAQRAETPWAWAVGWRTMDRMEVATVSMVGVVAVAQ